MAAEVISGREVARQIKGQVAERVERLKERGILPGLAAVLVGENPASTVYVGLKEKDCAAVGIRSLTRRLEEEVSQSTLEETILELNADPSVHGILLQHPLPKHLDEAAAIRKIAPAKDIDGVTPTAAGELVVGTPRMVSPTALGAMALLKSTGVEIAGKRAVVIGRSKIVGAPAAWLLLRENATVTVCHSRTRDLPSVAREAEILFVALDRAEFVTADFVQLGAVVIDCGYVRVSGRSGDVGGVDFESVRTVAGWLSPVPGGVGPAGRAMLVSNCVAAAETRVDSG